MKVLTFTPHGELPDFRGFSVAIVAQNFPLHFSGIQHLHVCDAERSPVGLVADETYGQIHRIHVSRLYRRLFQKWTKLDPNAIHRRMARIANRFKPDIIHVHQHEFPVVRFKKWLKQPARIVVHAHNLRDFDEDLGLADRYVAVSHVVAKRLIQTGAPPDRVVVVHNGVNVSLFKPALNEDKSNLRAGYGVPADIPVVLFFGRKEEQKGFDLFLEAVSACTDRFPTMLAIAVGPTLSNARTNSSYQRCCALRQSLSQRGILRDLEPVTHKELSNLIRLSDVALLPSREEPQGMAMIEAMASGLVVISSAVDGILESIQPGVNGILADMPSSGHQLSLLLAEILQHPENHRSLAEAAAGTALQRFSWKSQSALLQAHYQEMIRCMS